MENISIATNVYFINTKEFFVFRVSNNKNCFIEAEIKYSQIHKKY